MDLAMIPNFRIPIGSSFEGKKIAREKPDIITQVLDGMNGSLTSPITACLLYLVLNHKRLDEVDLR